MTAFSQPRVLPFASSSAVRVICTPMMPKPAIDPPERVEVRAEPSDAVKAAAEAAERFHRIAVAAVLSTPKSPGELLEREARLHQKVAGECVDRVVGALLQRACEDPAVLELAELYVRSVPNLRPQNSAVVVNILLLGGSHVSVETPYFLRRSRSTKKKRGRKRRPGARGKPGNGCYPILVILGIHQRVSPALAVEVARLAATGTFQEARASLAARGVSLDPKQVSRLAQGIARRALAHRAWRLERVRQGYRGSGLVRGRRLVIGVDGGRIRLREPNERGRRRKSGRRGFKNPWREPKVLVVYVIDPQGRKQPCGLVRYDATLQDADGLFALLTALLQEIGAQEASHWVFIGDGAEWIWNRVPDLIAAVGYDPTRVTQIVDFYHTLEHVTAIAEHVRGKRRRRRWFLRMKSSLGRGSADEILAEEQTLCKGRNAKKIRKLFKFFKDHKERMTYGFFRKQGLPLGSGAVESCIRRVVNLRFKSNGIYWRRANGEGLLYLRSQLLSGRWNCLTRAILEPESNWRMEQTRMIA